MLISSHILGTLILAKTFSVNIPELYVALLFGVAIDADHFFVNKKWIQDVKDFIKERKITYGINQHSWLQEFIFGTFTALAIGLSIPYIWPAIRWWIAPIFLLSHIALDSVMKYEHKPFTPFSKIRYQGWLRSGTKIEIFISLIGLFILIYYLY